MRSTLLHQFVTLFVVIDPIGCIPIFLAVVGNKSPKERAKTALKAVIIAGLIFLAFMVLGQFLFDVMDIGMNSFKIAGGLILFIIALRMVLFDAHSGSSEPDDGSSDKAVFPLAVPMLAGPASIMAVMVITDSVRTSFFDQVIAAAMVAVVLLISWIFFRLGDPIVKILKKDGIDVLSRIMGLILAALSVETVVRGIKGIIAGG